MTAPILTPEKYILADEGQHLATVDAIGEPMPGNYDYPYIVITFALHNLAEGVERMTVTGSASARLTRKTKLYQWCAAILEDTDADILDGEFDTAQLLDRQCTIVVEHSIKDEITYANVVDVLPAPQTGPMDRPAEAMAQGPF